MMNIKSPAQIEKMREAGQLLAYVMDRLRTMIEPGITTKRLNEEAERIMKKYSATPSFLGVPSSWRGYPSFPAAICASPDDQVVHGMPNDEPLKDGQIISIDCGVKLNGWHSDSAFTALVGDVPKAVRDLVLITEDCFKVGLRKAVVGNRVGAISHEVQKYAEGHGYGVVRELCGHGIGRELHEDPSVPNFGRTEHGPKLKSGMTICIEPMITLGGPDIFHEADGWTIKTRDHSACSHHEHTILITDGEPEILTLPRL